MTLERFQRVDKRLVAVAGIVIAASAWYIQANYQEAFPQASIDLRYSRQQISSRAREFLDSRGWSVKDYRHLAIFDSDDVARLFLERELGLGEANRLMAGPVSVWQWRARWFRPPQKEEYSVAMAPDGRLVGYQHVVEEDAPGARLSMSEARALAEAELRLRSAARQRLIEEKLEERPNRYDYSFTWEQEDFRARDATYRRTIVVQGAETASYAEYLHVPEQWQRDFAALRSKNELYTQIAQAFYIPLIAAAVVVLIQALRRRRVPWRPLVLFSAAVGALMIVNGWNSLPFFIYSMPTSSTYRESLTLGVLQALGSGVGVFFYVILAAAAGAHLYRAALPGKLALPAALSRSGIRTREFFRATVSGYAFAAAHIAFVVAFYLVGRRFGVWSPQDVEYSNLLSTAIPWISPLAISLLASASEEFWFRLFAIPLLARLLGFRWIAIVVPAFVWGFLHANYPQQPGYIRGIEVGVIGVAAGYLMYRFGILATLVWHYTVDAVLIGAFLLQSSNWYFRLSGLAVSGAVLLPLAWSLWRYRRQGGFVAVEEEAVEETPVHAPVEEAPPAAPLKPAWPRSRLYAAAAALVAGGLFLSPVLPGDFIRVKQGRAEALRAASGHLAARGEKPESWRHVADFFPNLDQASFEYLRRQEGARRANGVLRERTATAVWRVRFFRPQQKQEWRVYVNQQGEVLRTDRILAETDPGAQLSPAEARAAAERYLSTRGGIDANAWRLVDSSEQKRERRTDHSFVWEDPAFRAGEARSRVSLSMVGDDASEFRRFLKLPEQWLRGYTRTRLQSFLMPALAGALGLYLLMLFLRLLGRHHFRWRLYLWVTAAAFAVSLASQANRLPVFFTGYGTDRPLGDFLAESLLSIAMGLLVTSLGAFLAILALDAFLNWAQGKRRLPAPSLARALAMGGLAWGFNRVLGAIEQAIPGDRYSVPAVDFSAIGTVLPGWSVFASSLSSAFVFVALAGIGGAVAARVRSLPRLAGWGLFIAAAVAFARASNAWLWSYHFAAVLLSAAVLLLLFRTCAADLLTLGLAVFWLQALSKAWLLCTQPQAFLIANGAGAVVLAAAATWVFVSRFRRAAEARLE